MITIKTLLYTVGVLFSISAGMSSLHARHHAPKVTVRPAGYFFSTSYKVVMPHALVIPLKVWLSVGRKPTIALDSPIHQRLLSHSGKVHAGKFWGYLEFGADKKAGSIECIAGKHKKLEVEKKYRPLFSIWTEPLNKILENMWRYDTKAQKRTDLLYIYHHKRIRARFRIEPSKKSTLEAIYSLDPKSHTSTSYPAIPVHIITKKEVVTKGKRPVITVTAAFYPHKVQSGESPCSVLKYAMTKQGLREILRRNVNKHHIGWCEPVKKAANYSVRQYFKLILANKKLHKTY